MSKFYRFVKNEAGSSELYLEGVIASESWYDDEVSPKQFRDELDKVSGAITVRINSPGGDVFAGMQIYNMLKDRSGDVTVIVDALAASAASFIAMAGDKIIMNTGSMMMVHKASTIAWGNEDEMQEVIEMLRKTDDSIVSVYAARTGKSKEEIKQLLKDETWMTADEAVEMGFADEAMAGKTSLSNAVKNALSFSQEVQNAAMQPVMSIVTKLKNEAVEEVEAEAEAEEAEVTEEVTPEEVEQSTDEETEEVEAPAETEPEVETTETEELTETPVEETTNSVEETKMSDIDKEVAAEVVAQASPKQELQAEFISKNEARKMIVEALAATYAKDEAKFNEINDKVKTLQVKNVVDGTTGADLFAPEVLASDIRSQYEIVGRIGSLVNRIDIEGAETFRQVVETAGAGFRPVALGAVKQEDQPVWDSVVFEPFEWALIVAWLDGVAKRSPLAVYNQIVRYIARELARLEDKIVLTYAGGSVGSETRPATGLVPILTTANRDSTVASYDSDDVIPALGLAYGEVESDQAITLVANRRTWAQLATSLDGEGRPIFTVIGEQVAAGALGTFRVVLSNELDDGDVVVGAFADYNLVTRGAFGTLFSREATVGDLNLFTQDASALRADIDITGGPVFVESFYLLQFPAAS